MTGPEQPEVPALHPVFWIACVWNLALLLIDLGFYLHGPVTLERVTFLMMLGLFGVGGVFLLLGVFYRTVRPDPPLSDTSFASALVLFGTQLAGIFSVFGVHQAPPLIDSQLAAVDAALGFHAPAISAFFQHHAWLQMAIAWCYDCFVPQIFLSVVILGILLQDREALWSYVFYYAFAVTVTLTCFAIVQAEGPTGWYTDYPAEIVAIQRQVCIDAYRLIRSGALLEINHEHIQGFVTFPSFHAASGYAALAAFWGHPRLWVPLAVINTGLVIGTVSLGAHYAIDPIVSIGIWAAGVLAYRRLRRA